MKRTRTNRNGNSHPDGMLRVCSHCQFVYRSHAKGNIFQICPRCKAPLFVNELLQETKTMLRAASERLDAAKFMANGVSDFDEFAYDGEEEWERSNIDPIASLTLMQIFSEDIKRQLELMDLLDDIFVDGRVDLEYLEAELKQNLERIRAKRAEREAEREAARSDTDV
jgi:hypothetical protein